MSEGKALLIGFTLDGRGGGSVIPEETLDSLATKVEPYWIHLNIDNEIALKWLQEKSGLDQFIIEALLADATRPRVIESEDSLLVILRGVNLNVNEEPEDMVSIRIYLDKNRMISCIRRKLSAVHWVEEKLLKSQGPKNTGELLAIIADILCDAMEPTLAQLNGIIDALEDQVIDTRDAVLKERIVDVRKQAVMFRRYLAPQRDAFMKLKNTNHLWVDKKSRRHFQESLDMVTRFVEDLDAIRDRSQIVQDELTNALSEKLNANTYVLSVIAAIFLPMGFLTGLFGVNLAGIPGAEHHIGFWLFTFFLIVVLIVQVYVFRKMKWF